MRLWSLHPRYLDRAGLVALWREGLLARAVLLGKTVGYKNHPQLARFRATRDAVATLDRYLAAVYDEARGRGYRFDATKIARRRGRPPRLPVTAGQLQFELKHLRAKTRRRDPDAYRALRELANPSPHPLFAVVPGPPAEWEKAATITGSAPPANAA